MGLFLRLTQHSNHCNLYYIELFLTELVLLASDALLGKNKPLSGIQWNEFIDKMFVKSDSRTHNVLQKQQRLYQSATKTQVTERILKLIPIHA